ncbi:hypothetical protein LUZ60_001545 [Juncus effusus]|nr:hypothetical protein LUZ60_001545 [Juncus effusus]
MVSYQTILLSLALLLFVRILLSFITTNKNKRLPPSPLSLPLIGHLHLIKKPLHQSLARISDRYGPATFLRFGSRPVLVISSRKLAEQCFTTHDLAFANRVHLPSAKANSFNYSGIGGANYGPYWRNVRRIAAVELLSPQRLMASSDIRADEVLDMARRLFRSWKADSDGLRLNNGFRKVELKTSLFELSLNLMMTMIAGKRFYGDNIEDLEETKRFREAVEEGFSLAGASNVEDFVPFLKWLDLNGVIKKKRGLAKTNNEMAQKLIDELRKNEDEMKIKKKTMISDLLELQKKDPEGYKDEIIKGICLSLLLAGTDTSSNTVEWAMSLLLNNPKVLQKARDEIDKHVGNKRLIQESDMANLPYLHCILSEVLRLYPGGPLLVPHESRENISLEGYKIPQGTMLLVNAYHIHRDPDMWRDPTEFRPERFENGETEEKWMIPFGMGRRRCPGEGLAMREVVLILGTLIQCFDWERIEDRIIDLTEGSGLTLPKAVPLEALYRPREIMFDVLEGI